MLKFKLVVKEEIAKRGGSYFQEPIGTTQFMSEHGENVLAKTMCESEVAYGALQYYITPSNTDDQTEFTLDEISEFSSLFMQNFDVLPTGDDAYEEPKQTEQTEQTFMLVLKNEDNTSTVTIPAPMDIYQVISQPKEAGEIVTNYLVMCTFGKQYGAVLGNSRATMEKSIVVATKDVLLQLPEDFLELFVMVPYIATDGDWLLEDISHLGGLVDEDEMVSSSIEEHEDSEDEDNVSDISDVLDCILYALVRAFGEDEDE